MYNHRPKPIADLVNEFVSNYSDRSAMLRGSVLHQWREVVGSMIADQCHNVRFDAKNRLIVHVQNASWRHEIHMQRHQLMEMLNREAGGTIITDVIVRS